ncbi:transposase [Flavobacterium sp. FZUC8N2.13]|uniref:transposase n=1 Tax=Flavobacterium zubiriense TaxID=3138075 RepID=UPI00358F626A
MWNKLDNSPIHKSNKWSKTEKWKVKDVLIYFLPPHSPELFLIETLWRREKYQCLAFDAY